MSGQRVDEDDTFNDYDRWVECPDCEEPIPIGGWPFCASPANPDGHTRGTYNFAMRMSMKTNGWTRRLR